MLENNGFSDFLTMVASVNLSISQTYEEMIQNFCVR